MQTGINTSFAFNNFKYGLTIKNYTEKISDYTGKSFLFDFGFLLQGLIKNLDFGAAALNIGDKITFNSKKENISILYALGLKYSIYRFDLLGDVKKIGNDKSEFSGGLNFRFDDRFYIMCGYNGVKNVNGLPSFGLSYTHDYFGVGYAYDNYSEAGDLHYLTVSFAGRPAIKKMREASVIKKMENKEFTPIVNEIMIEPFVCSRCKTPFETPVKYCPNCGKINEHYETAVKIFANKRKSSVSADTKPIQPKINYVEFDIEKLYSEAQQAFVNKEYEAVIELLKKYLENSALNLNALKMIGDSYYELKDFDNAIFYYSRIQKYYGIK